MKLDRIVCLANSYKHEHRCVAGISLSTKKWLRLVSSEIPGCIPRERTCYADGKESQVLDVFEVELGDPCGTSAHPEDVLISKKQWRRVQHLNGQAGLEFLTKLVSPEPIILEGYSDRIAVQKFQERPARMSLGLIHPEDLWWWIREEKGKRKYRANFRLGRTARIRYDLPVTDPAWLDQLHLLPSGIHPNTTLCGNQASQTFLTVSLSEPFEGFHYKLAAGVVLLPLSK